MNLRPAWSTQWIRGQPELCREPVSKKVSYYNFWFLSYYRCIYCMPYSLNQYKIFLFLMSLLAFIFPFYSLCLCQFACIYVYGYVFVWVHMLIRVYVYIMCICAYMEVKVTSVTIPQYQSSFLFEKGYLMGQELIDQAKGRVMRTVFLKCGFWRLYLSLLACITNVL